MVGVTLVLEPDGVVVDASPVACEVFGRPAEEIIGRPLSDLVRSDVSDLVSSAASGAVRRELMLKTPRGLRVLPCEVSTSVTEGRTQVRISGRDLAGRRFLVADDQPLMRSSVERILSRRGAMVVLAEDGEQAETLLRTKPFDVLVLDVVMPGRTGYQVLATARELFPSLPVILMTGDATGVPPCDHVPDHTLDKPFTMRALDEVVDRLLAPER
jgi:CheY-like chemotaxis protein